MITLNFEQMESVTGGLKGRGWTCASQILGGLSTSWGLAGVLAFGTNPVGWAVLALGAASLAITVAQDVSACDT